MAGSPAIFTYDSDLSVSLISTQFITRHAITVTSDEASVSVSMPALGMTFTSVLKMTVVPHLNWDACLGCDWMGLCRAMGVKGVTTFPLGNKGRYADVGPTSIDVGYGLQSESSCIISLNQLVHTVRWQMIKGRLLIWRPPM